MAPNIFISSTILDLADLRDSIRDLLLDIGYNPIMSEYGEIGYLPSSSAEDSCYLALRDCQLAIVIVGKRYGSISDNGFSVTHNEFRTTRDRKVPVIFLVNDEVLAYKKVYDLNEENQSLTFPGMDNPGKIFQLIREFSDSEINNGLVQFSNVQSAKTNLKKQLAHIFSDLIRKQFDPVKGEIKDILSEITTLRHILVKGEQEIARKFSAAFRFLLNEENNYLKETVEKISVSLEEAVPELIESQNFHQYLLKNGVDVRIMESDEAFKELEITNNGIFGHGIDRVFYSTLPYQISRNQATFGGENVYELESESQNDKRVVLGVGHKKYWTNKNGDKLMNAIFTSLKKQTE